MHPNLKPLAALALAFAAGWAVAQPAAELTRPHDRKLTGLLDGCHAQSKDLLAIRDKVPQPDKERAIEQCAVDGKAALRTSHDQVKAALAGKKLPPELVDWRTAWLTAFEAVVPQEREAEPTYRQRQADARKVLATASSRLESALP